RRQEHLVPKLRLGTSLLSLVFFVCFVCFVVTLLTMHARQAVIVEPFKAEVREVDLPAPAANQILVQTEASALSAGTELAVWTGTHQWLKDPTLPDWKFPFRPGYSAAGTVMAVGSAISDWQPGDRVSYPGNHASAELLAIGHERGRLWKLPSGLDADKV